MTNDINKKEKIFIAGAYGMVGSSIYRCLSKNKENSKKI